MLSALSIQGYRCFPRETRLELRPITLLLGRNNAGKSTLLRLLPILADSISESAPSPWDLSGPAGGGSAFVPSLWQGAPSRTLDLSLEWREPNQPGDLQPHRQDRYRLRYDDHHKQTYVERLNLGPVVPERGAAAFYSLPPNPDTDTDTFRFLHRTNPTSEDQRVLFDPVGLVPGEDVADPDLRALRLRLRSLRGHIQWLGPVRAPIPRTIVSHKKRLRIDHDGGNAASIVIQDPRVLNGVNAWYQHPTIRRKLRVQEIASPDYNLLLDNPQPSLYSALLGNPQPFNINLADTGDGMSQVLHVLVAAEIARLQGPHAILAVEDPEAHLHEDARRTLAEHFCRLAAQPDAPRFVLETHSRTFLLGVQLAIAQGTIDPSAVVAYWCAQEPNGQSHATEVTFDARGAPKSTVLNGVLSEDLRLARELLDLQLA